jgi:hypothetical protein
VVRVCIVVRDGSCGVGGGRPEMLLCTSEIDGGLHLSRVMLGDRRPECMLQASDEEVDFMKLASDADM